jgi:hypothetical protein
VGAVYEIREVPAEIPVNRPVVDPTVAIPILLLLHVQPVVASVNVSELPAQAMERPEIAAGVGFTVTDFVAIILPQENGTE